MADKNIEEILWAEYKRIIGDEKLYGPSDVQGFVNQMSLETSQTTEPAGSDSRATTSKSQAQTPQADSTASSGFATKVENTATNLGNARFAAMPLISTLIGLFGGGSKPETPEPLVKYAMPRSLHLVAANSGDGTGYESLDYGQDGLARAYAEKAPTDTAWSGTVFPDASSTLETSGTSPQIVVNVQAMDSRSFLDHSQEIAQAVREAMLNMHSLNDVVSEL